MPDSGEHIGKKGNERRLRTGRKDKPYEKNICNTYGIGRMAGIGNREPVLNCTLGRWVVHDADGPALGGHCVHSLA